MPYFKQLIKTSETSFNKLPAAKATLLNSAYTTCHTLKQVKQNATNNPAPFFRSTFNALSDGVLRFAHCVTP